MSSVTILAPGSRGDVQPYLALAQGFLRAGHRARVVTTSDHEALLRGYGVDVVALPFSVQAALEGRVGAAIEGGGAVSSFREISRIAKRGAALLLEQGLEATRGADLLVSNFGTTQLAEVIGQRCAVPVAQAFNVPLTPTGLYPGALTPGLDFGPCSRRLGHALTRQGLWLTARMASVEALKGAGAPAPPVRAPRGVPGLLPGKVVYGLSEAFLPRDPAWGDDVELTGFWFVEEAADWRPPPELDAFLAAGPPPVCIGFGSMGTKDPAAMTALVLEAVRRAGVRCVLLSGWAGLDDATPPPGVLVLRQAPHSWLVPRCSAVVHHGGAGTTAAALRAGVPAIVVPFHGDQPFWAQRVFASGTGPRPIPRGKLSAEALTAALKLAVEDAQLRESARALGARVRGDDGVGRAVTSLLQLARAEAR